MPVLRADRSCSFCPSRSSRNGDDSNRRPCLPGVHACDPSETPQMVYCEADRMNRTRKPVAVVRPLMASEKENRRRSRGSDWNLTLRLSGFDAGDETFDRSSTRVPMLVKKFASDRALGGSIPYLRLVLSPSLLCFYEGSPDFQRLVLQFFADSLVVSGDSRAHFDYEALTRDCGFYYDGMSSTGARRHLRGLPTCSFLVRSSSDPTQCLHALSVKTDRGVTSVRLPPVKLWHGRSSFPAGGRSPVVVTCRPRIGIRLDCNEEDSKRSPVFDSVLHLVSALRRIPEAAPRTAASANPATAFTSGRRAVFLQFDDRPLLALRLGSPAVRKVPSLRRLAMCSFVLRQDATEVLLGLEASAAYSIESFRFD